MYSSMFKLAISYSPLVIPAKIPFLRDFCPKCLFSTPFDCLVVLIKDIFEQTAVIWQAICGSVSTTEESNIKRTQFDRFIKWSAPPWIDTRQDETKHKYTIVSYAGRIFGEKEKNVTCLTWPFLWRNGGPLINVIYSGR